MTDSTHSDSPKRLDDADLDDVSGGSIPDFVYEFESELDEADWKDVLHRFNHGSGWIYDPYLLLRMKLLRVGDYAGARRVEEYFYECYHMSLRNP